MKKITVLFSFLLATLFSITLVSANEVPQVTYDENNHKFYVENTSGNDFFSGLKNVIPGDIRSQSIEFVYKNVSNPMNVYLKARCDDETQDLLKDMTINIYIDDVLIAENKRVFEDIHIAGINSSLKQNVQMVLQVPTSVGNEIAGKSAHIQWIITVQEEQNEKNQSNSNQSDGEGQSKGINTKIDENQSSVWNDNKSSGKDKEVSYTTVIDEKQPLGGKNNGTWALLNLISSAFTILISIFLFMAHKKEKEEAEKQIEIGHRHVVLSIISVIISIFSVFFFIRTEDILLEMVWIDSYTIYMVGLMMVNIALLILGKTIYLNKEM